VPPAAESRLRNPALSLRLQRPFRKERELLLDRGPGHVRAGVTDPAHETAHSPGDAGVARRRADQQHRQDSADQAGTTALALTQITVMATENTIDAATARTTLPSYVLRATSYVRS